MAKKRTNATTTGAKGGPKEKTKEKKGHGGWGLLRSAEHLRMGNNIYMAKYDETKAVLRAALAAADAGVSPSHLPSFTYEGRANALTQMLYTSDPTGEEPDIAKVRELLDAGIDVRYQVRVSCVYAFVIVLSHTSEAWMPRDMRTTCTGSNSSFCVSLSLYSPSPSFLFPPSALSFVWF